MELIASWFSAYRGELAALSAAFLWAASSTVYGLLGQQIRPLQLNLYKGLVALALISLTLLIKAQPLALEWEALRLLLLSGAAGIGCGDTAYFAALNHLGARRTLLMETLVPPMAALLALVFLGEQLSLTAWCGVLVTILGVIWVITERTGSTSVGGTSFVRGVGWAMLAAIAQAGGAVLSRFAFLQSSISPLWSTSVRLSAGTLVVLLLMLVRRQSSAPQVKIVWSVRLIGVIVIAAFGSAYLGIWLQQTALKFTLTGVAQTLLATSPLFVLPIAAGMGDKISPRAIFGVLVAIAGIGILFSNQ